MTLTPGVLCSTHQYSSLNKASIWLIGVKRKVDVLHSAFLSTSINVSTGTLVFIWRIGSKASVERDNMKVRYPLPLNTFSPSHFRILNLQRPWCSRKHHSNHHLSLKKPYLYSTLEKVRPQENLLTYCTCRLNRNDFEQHQVGCYFNLYITKCWRLVVLAPSARKQILRAVNPWMKNPPKKNVLMKSYYLCEWRLPCPF